MKRAVPPRSMSEGNMASVETTIGGKGSYRASFWIVAIIFLTIIVLVPIAVIDLLANVAKPSENHVYNIAAEVLPAPVYSRLHVNVLALDEVQKLATLRVSGFHFCASECTARDKILFSSIGADGKGADGLPPSASITLPAASGEFSTTFQLPIASTLLRYPFDRSGLMLGISLQRVSADNKTTVVPPVEAKDQVFVTLQQQVPRVTMSAPDAVDPQTVQPAKVKADYIYVSDMEFSRPAYLKILVVFIVILSAIAAVYAAFFRPFSQLLINAGALILGIFAVRSLLIGGYPPDATLVDILLTATVFFLLCAIAVRGMGYLHQRGSLDVPRLPEAATEEADTNLPAMPERGAARGDPLRPLHRATAPCRRARRAAHSAGLGNERHVSFIGTVVCYAACPDAGAGQAFVRDARPTVSAPWVSARRDAPAARLRLPPATRCRVSHWHPPPRSTAPCPTRR